MAPPSRPDGHDGRVGGIEDVREGGLGRGLQPILRVIFGMRRGLDHVEGVCVASVGAGVALRLVQHAPVDKDQVT